MAAPKRETIQIEVTSVAAKGDLVTFGLSVGGIEVQRASHPDIKKVRAGTCVEVEINSKDRKKLDSGNVISGSFVGIKMEQATAVPRVSDSKSS